MNFAYFQYWGKARPTADSVASCHLLPYHCLDVAAVGIQYLRHAPALRRLFMEELGIAEVDTLEAWMAFWLSLHDLGKFGRSFQWQCPEVVAKLRGPQSGLPSEYTLRHDSMGMLYWKEVLSETARGEDWGLPGDECLDGLDWWFRAVTGHHGQPPLEAYQDVWRHFDRRADRQAINEFLDALRDIFLAPARRGLSVLNDSRAFEQCSNRLTWWIAGLAVLADWVGSNADYFPYEDGQVDLQRYWARALTQAERALEAAELLPVRGAEGLAFSDLFPHIGRPSPLQRWSVDAALAKGPQIHLLEDVTGAGKTEAAVTLAHRLMAEGQADGFFIALPTMSTANAMYERVALLYQRLFSAHASLALAHGQRDLVGLFAASVIRAGQQEADTRQLDETATARCSAWLADHNKRALLAPAGVGTIDQVLLAVLHSKHQSLRLLGLFRKVLVIDEVHACDPYMQGVLEVLLEFHARAGGSVILLSATLPRHMKQSLFAAFARGCSTSMPPLQEEAYPLITSWAPSEPGHAEQLPIDTRPDVQRTLAIRYTAEQDEVIAEINRALVSGQCVCWMRNTVADALAAYARFSTVLDSDRLMLFHARFALGDRLHMEQRVLHHFGKNSTPDLRRGRLVIATQVAEQSLDADWDLVVSDLAPIDRLIQRAGRLQRHPRDRTGARLLGADARDERGEPCLWVLGPCWTSQPAAGWFKEAFPKSAKVYAHHGQLWLTARLLQEGRLAMPCDARRLIEAVFGEDVEMPEGLRANANRAEGDGLSEVSLAQQNTVKLALGYRRDVIDWWSEAKTPSRVGEASMTVVLSRWVGDVLKPFKDGASCRDAWAYSSLRVPERLIAKTCEPPCEAERLGLAKALETLPDKGKWSVLLPLRETPEGWVGQALASRGDQFTRREWLYDAAFGLRAK